MALLGAASMTGVPAFGFPKISSLVGRNLSPTFSASPPWSTTANSNSLRLQNPFELLDRFIRRVITGYIDETSHFTERHSYLFE